MWGVSPDEDWGLLIEDDEEKENEGGDDMSILDQMKLRNKIEIWLIFLPYFGCGSLGAHLKIG